MKNFMIEQVVVTLLTDVHRRLHLQLKEALWLIFMLQPRATGGVLIRTGSTGTHALIIGLVSSATCKVK